MPWHEIFLIGMGKVSAWVPAELVLKGILWCGIWWLSFQMIAPIINWPFETDNLAWRAALTYAAGTIIIPLLIAGMCQTNHIPFWQEREQIKNPSLRFFTHLGASVGYEVAALSTLFIAVLFYDILGLVISPWLSGIGSLLGLFIGFASAHQIPYNQWRLYGKLHWKDAGVFVIFFILGPFAAASFFLYYHWLLSSFTGTLLITISVIILIVARIAQRKNHTVL